MDKITDSKMHDVISNLARSEQRNKSFNMQTTPIVSVNLIKPMNNTSQRNGLSDYLE